MNKKTVILKIVLIFIILTMTAEASTWYIAANGSDNIGCGLTENPCATVQNVLNNKVGAGDTIKIKAGTYSGWSGNFWADINTPSKHNGLTITADDPNNRPLIQGTSAKWGLIWIRNNVTGVTISYLRLAHSTDRIKEWKNGVIQIKSNPTTIDNCEIMNGFNGVSIETNKNVIISNNKIHTNGKPPTTCIPSSSYDAHGGGIGIYNFDNLPPSTGWDEKIYVYNNEIYNNGEHGLINVNTFYRYIELAYNNVYNNGESGFDWKDNYYTRIHHNLIHENCGNGIGSNNAYPSTDFEIWANSIYDNRANGINIQGSSISNWKIYNNLIYSNGLNYQYGGMGINLNGQGHEVYHNVIYGHNPSTNRGHSVVGNGIIKNNIFYNNGIGTGGGTNGGGGDHNYVYPATGNVGTNAITVPNPGMTDPVNADFTLLPNSPLIDAGTDVGITTDYDGNPRPQGNGYDIGAYEYTTSQINTPVVDDTIMEKMVVYAAWVIIIVMLFFIFRR